MADITSSVTINSVASQEIIRPPSWHIYEVTIPDGTMGTSGTDDILLPGRYGNDVYCLDMCLVVTDPVTIGTSCAADVEMALRAISDGALSSAGNTAVANVDLTDTTTEFGAAVAHTLTGDFGSAVTVGTNERVVNIEVNPVGATSTDCTFLVGLLLGRTEY